MSGASGFVGTVCISATIVILAVKIGVVLVALHSCIVSGYCIREEDARTIVQLGGVLVVVLDGDHLVHVPMSLRARTSALDLWLD